MSSPRKSARLSAVQLNVRVPGEIATRLKAHARVFNRSQAEVVTEALTQYWERQSPEDRRFLDQAVQRSRRR